MTNKNKRLLLFFVIISSIVVFVFAVRMPVPAGQQLPTNGSVVYVKKQVPQQLAHKAFRIKKPSTSTSGNVVQQFFLASRQTGIIGLYGRNQTDNPVDNIFSVRIDEVLSEKDAVWLTYRLTGVEDFSNVACCINDRLAFGGRQIKTTDSTKIQRISLSPLWLTTGINRIQFGLPEHAAYGYKVSDLSIEVLKNGASSPLSIQVSPSSYNGNIYVHGFTTKGTISAIQANGTNVNVRDNEFEALIPVKEQRLALTAMIDGKRYSRHIAIAGDIKADTVYCTNNTIVCQSRTFVKGEAGQLRIHNAALLVDRGAMKRTQKLSLTSLRGVDIPAMDLGLDNVTDENVGFRFLPHGEHFSKAATVALKYDRTKIPDGYTENDIRTFYFDASTKHWVALGRDSVNKALCMVYSKTTHFTDMINGVIKAPESPETQGFIPTMMNDIKAADPASKIEVIAPPTANNMGSANLSYNLEMPPSSNGISPNLAVQYNSDGGSGWLGEGWDLNIPSITVDTRWGVPRYDRNYETETYNMGGVMLATVVDTLNTDTLGAASVAHKGVLFQRLIGLNNEGVQFHPVTENGFSRITRIGNTPGNYYWEVITKEGVTYTYGEKLYNAALGGTVNTFEYENLSSTKKTRKAKTAIAEWRLSSVKDQYRNFCRYYYTIDSFKVFNDNVYAKSIRLSQIKIGRSKMEGSNDVDTIYQVVDFIQKTARQKRTTNARYGFLTSTNPLLLDTVKIRHYEPNGTLVPVRNYAFNYAAGVFNTMLLNKISQCDDLNDTVASHTLSYYNNISGKYYQPEETMNTTSVEDANDANTLDATTIGLPALGGSTSKNSSGSFHIGGGVGGNWGGAEMGYNYSISKTSSDSKMMMIDINGDGLPDKIYKGSYNKAERLCFIPNLGNGRFDSCGIVLDGYNGNFSYSTSNSHTNGWSGDVTVGIKKARVTANVGMDWLTSSSETPTYLADVNSDGLIDIVDGGTVYFNSISSYNSDGVAIPSFSTNSGVTPRPLMNIKSIRGKAGVLKLSDLFQSTPGPSKNEQLSPVAASDAPIRRDTSIVLEEKVEDYDQMPMQDVIRFWEAPHAGTVSIHSHIKYLGDVNAICTDGVRLAIQKGGSEIWNDSIKPDDANLERTLSLSNIDVTAGQRIYFRLQSGSNYFSDGLEDVVLWQQEVFYQKDRQMFLADEDGYEDEWYRSSEGSFVSLQFDNKVDSVASDMYVDGSFSKPATNDSVILKLYASTDSLISRDSVAMELTTDSLTGAIDTAQITYKIWFPNPDHFSEELAWEHAFGKEAITVNNMGMGVYGNVYGPVNFRFEMSSNTNLPWEKIKWKPKIQYSRLSGKDTVLYAGVKYNVFEKKYHVGEGNYEYFSGNNNSPSINEYVIPTIELKSKRVVNTNYTLVMYTKKYTVYNMAVKPVATFYGHITNNVNKLENFVIDTLKPDAYFFSVYINDTISADSVTATCHFKNCNPSTVYVPYIYCRQPLSRSIMGLRWRGWGQFQYNAGNGRYAKPIEEDSLYLPDNTSQQSMEKSWGIKNMCLFNMTHKPCKESYYWSGTNDYLLISGDTMCAGRLNDGEMPAILLPAYTTPAQKAPTMLLRNRITSGPEQTLSGAIYKISDAPTLSSRSKATTSWGGASAEIGTCASVGGNLAKSTGETKITSAYMDMNGDGFPDYITDDRVEYTNPNGGRDGEVDTIMTEISNNDSESYGFSGSCTAALSEEGAVSPDKNTTDNNGHCSSLIAMNLSKDLNANINYSNSKNNTTSTTSYIDLNGDGLPDRLYLDKGKVKVCLNLGYGFSIPIDWGLTEISHTQSISNSVGASCGASYTKALDKIIAEGGKNGAKALKWAKKLNLGINVGVNGVSTTNYSLSNLFDVNMDGLPDKIYKSPSGKVAVQFNIGIGFTNPITMEEIEAFYKSCCSSTGANLSININISLFFLRLSLGASGSLGWATDYTLNQLMDIDGDGFPDVVKANDMFGFLAQLNVKRSLIGCTNKLSAVSNPFGGTIRLNYARTQASYDHPGGKWVMSAMSVNDGISDDGDSLMNRFTYGEGKYDRYEREFLGFGNVLTENVNTAIQTLPDYRKIRQAFDNSNYYNRGTLLSSEIIGVDGSTENTYSKTTNQYHTYSVSRISHSSNADKLGKYCLKEISPESELTKANLFLHQYIIYSPLKYTQNTAYAYSGSTQSSLVTSESYSDYDIDPGTHGEISVYKFSDKGGLGVNGTGVYNYMTTISYLRDKPLMTLFALPVEVIVTGYDQKVYRKTLAVWNDNFASQLRVVKNVIAPGDTATTTLGYDNWGNICQKELPGKIKNDRMWYTYKYDSFYHLFPIEVSDHFNYTSKMGDYNYIYGIP
ncbi:MAG: toxin TcdB middle/N-terminal domain-containing protein, partial [Bacteroidota bacterium]|nr:toxin TcdB middle/N-terminal domain-containing protein [Bacteroidota bacterium]